MINLYLKSVLKMLQNIFNCVDRREVFWLVIESVKLNCVPWGWWVKLKYDKLIAEKCVEDASEYI